MSRPKRELQKRFVVFCEGDTEYNYIDKMRKRQDVQIALKPINMHGGGYTNFLRKIKTESQTNCLAKLSRPHYSLLTEDRIKLVGWRQGKMAIRREFSVFWNLGLRKGESFIRTRREIPDCGRRIPFAPGKRGKRPVWPPLFMPGNH